MQTFEDGDKETIEIWWNFHYVKLTPLAGKRFLETWPVYTEDLHHHL